MNRITDLVECLRVRRLLPAYLDGELGDQDGAALVVRHLQACRRCGLAADSIQVLKDRLARFRSDPDPAQVRRIERLIEELTQRSAGPER